MRLTSLVAILGAVSSTTNAFQVPFAEDIKQFIFDSTHQDSVLLEDPASYIEDDMLAKQRKKIGNLKESHYPEVKEAWREMEDQLGLSKLQKLIDKYNEKFVVKSDRLHNRVNQQVFDKDLQFEVVSNEKFRDHSLRIKESNPEILGLDSVNQYTGYLDIAKQGKHLFYWLFESRNDPENDPVILWLNGGPGCSSATGLFFELGPSLINSTIQPVYNPYSWNSNATVIFLDQPVGVGYSYTEGEEIKNTASAAKDVYIFLELFYQKFPQFLKNKFHIAGESYAGHYIPSFAAEIINNADRSFELSSVLIGNGITDPLIQYGAYKPMGCGEGGYKPVLEEETCEKMDRDYPKCATLTDICYKAPSAITCVPATYYCESALFGPYSDTGLNPYDIRKNCEDEGGNCYKEMDYLDDYLNLDYVKEAVGASNIDIFTSCDDIVFRNFILNGDEQKPFQDFVSELLEYNIPVLIYAGDKDYICNWLGNHYWTDSLDYEDHEFFEKVPLRPWYTKDGKLAGEVKNYKHFTFLRVYDAGHMVPFDQPENSLDMVNRWIQGEYSYGY